MWQGGQSNRVVQYLFAGNAPAIDAMNRLAIQVRRCEESEIAARRASPENAASTAVVTAVQQMSERAAAREEEMMRQQRAVFEQLMRQVGGDAASVPPLPPRPEQVATDLMSRSPSQPPSSVLSEALPGAREKRKAHSQDDVVGFASHPTLATALAYAREDLAPLERSEAHKWRRRRYEDGRKDNSRHNHWLKYRNLAIAVGLGEEDEGAALACLETRRATFASAKAFAAALEADHRSMTFEAQEEVAKRVLGY